MTISSQANYQFSRLLGVARGTSILDGEQRTPEDLANSSTHTAHRPNETKLQAASISPLRISPSPLEHPVKVGTTDQEEVPSTTAVRFRVHFDERRNDYYEPQAFIMIDFTEDSTNRPCEENNNDNDSFVYDEFYSDDLSEDGNDDDDDDDCYEYNKEVLWYTSEESQQMKEAHKTACRSLHRQIKESLHDPDAHAHAILVAYHACDRGHMTPSLWSAIGSCSDAGPSSSPSSHLVTRMGLEQVVINAAVSRDHKRRRRQRLIEEAVYECIPENHATFSVEFLAEVLRERCHVISRPARLFALAVGQAQACYDVQDDDDSNHALFER